MIAVDTSALMAVVMHEAAGDTCLERLLVAAKIVMSAGTFAEALIVAGKWSVSEEMADLITNLAVDIIPVTSASARRAAAAYRQWGKGVHPAGLNYGDCCSYELAKSLNCGLLFIGDDFAKTDIERVL